MLDVIKTGGVMFETFGNVELEIILNWTTVPVVTTVHDDNGATI